MASFLDAAKKLGPRELRARNLALDFELRPPVRLSVLLRKMKLTLDPETVAHGSGELGPSTTSGRAQVLLNSAGFWCYRGHMHESGFIGHHYAFSAAFDFHDAVGRMIGFSQQGEIDGTVDVFGSRDSDWQQQGHDRFIADNWESLKRARIGFQLRVQTDASEAIVAGTGIGIVVATVGAGFGFLAADPKTHCDASGEVEATGSGVDAGADLRCRREF